MNNYCVYMHTSPSNKKYIGITSQKPERRWREGKSYKDNEYFTKAIKKYGWENFKHEILYTGLSEKQAKVLEVSLIVYYESRNTKKGYNISEGGDIVSGETRKKISESLKGKPSNCGKNNPASKSVICLETKAIFDTIKEAEKISGAGGIQQAIKNNGTSGGYHWAYYKDGLENKTNILLDEIKQKKELKKKEFKKYRSEYMKLNNPNFKNKSHSEEVIRQIAEKHQKKVRCIELNVVFDSIKEATEYFNGKSKSSIGNVLKGRSKTAFGYHWEYLTK